MKAYFIDSYSLNNSKHNSIVFPACCVIFPVQVQGRVQDSVSFNLLLSPASQSSALSRVKLKRKNVGKTNFDPNGR